jgi:bifunctional non-homologous end joining protein LigD
LEELGVISFLKTTGGKGLHVVAPLTPAYGWDTIKSFARAIADSMVHDNPDRYIATMSKAARKGKIFVDYLRNDVTSTAVAPFSVRARSGAPVSMPLAWEELTGKMSPAAITIATVPRQLQKRKKDPWQAFLAVKQKIAAEYLRALKIEF